MKSIINLILVCVGCSILIISMIIGIGGNYESGTTAFIIIVGTVGSSVYFGLFIDYLLAQKRNFEPLTISDISKDIYGKTVVTEKVVGINLSKKNRIIVFIVVFAVSIFAVKIISNVNVDYSVQSVNYESQQDNKDVWACAVDYVKTELKNPSSASFCKYSEATISYTESTGIYTIKGYVDATNSFGATIRQNFTCNLKPTTEGYTTYGILFN